jgi:hypothetical protein
MFTPQKVDGIQAVSGLILLICNIVSEVLIEKS